MNFILTFTALIAILISVGAIWTSTFLRSDLKEPLEKSKNPCKCDNIQCKCSNIQCKFKLK